MQKIMAIFAHPDDEGAVAGTLAMYASQGMEVTLVCATRGEAGEISDPALATAETLGTVRQKELEAACEILGIQQLYFLDYCDSGMAGTAENGKATSAAKQATARSTAARMPPAALRGAQRNDGECTDAHALDRIEGTITATTSCDLNPIRNPTAARGRPLPVHVHESTQTQLAPLTHTLLAGSAVRDRWTIG